MLLTSASLRAGAQVVEIPRRNPRATVAQRVGLTDITVDYDSPAVRGRAIWGSLVPFDHLWRTGEIPAPRIAFSRDVWLADAFVPAGTYALLLVPARGDWTAILNRSSDLLRTERRYDPVLDVARVRVRATAAPHRERLAFVFSDFTNERASLDLEWEQVRVSLPIKVDTARQLVAGLQSLDEIPRRYAMAARYMLETKKDYDVGLAYIDKAIALEDRWVNVWIKASLLAAKGRYREARDQADRAYQMGQEGGGDASLPPPEVRKAIADWGKSAGRTPPAARNAAAPVSEAVVTALVEPAAAQAANVGERPARVHQAGQASTTARRQKAVEIGPLLERGKADIVGCYQRALRKDTSLVGGKMTISVTVGSSGQAKNVALDRPAPLRVLEPCIKEVVGHWVFPRAAVEYGVELPVVLQGRE